MASPACMEAAERKRQYAAMGRAIVKSCNPSLLAKYQLCSDTERCGVGHKSHHIYLIPKRLLKTPKVIKGDPKHIAIYHFIINGWNWAITGFSFSSHYLYPMTPVQVDHAETVDGQWWCMWCNYCRRTVCEMDWRSTKWPVHHCSLNRISPYIYIYINFQHSFGMITISICIDFRATWCDSVLGDLAAAWAALWDHRRCQGVHWWAHQRPIFGGFCISIVYDSTQCFCFSIFFLEGEWSQLPWLTWINTPH